MKTQRFRNIVKLALFVFSLLVSAGNLHAQILLNIEEANNTITKHTLQDVKKLYFPTESVLQIEKNVGSVQYPLPGVKKIYFGTLTTSNNSVPTIHSKTRLYPIPAKDQFTVELVAENTESARIEIIDLAGRLVSAQIVELNSGINTFTINSSFLKKGIFLCKIIKTKSTEVIKFNKQ